MVVAAHDMRNVHVVVVNDDGQHVGGRAVRAQQHGVVEVLIGKHDAALHAVLDNRLAVLRRLQADDGLEASGVGGLDVGCGAVAPASVIAGRALFSPRQLAHVRQLLCGRETFIGLALSQHLAGDFGVAGGAGELENRLAFPIQPQPLQAVDDGGDGGLRRALAIRILNAQQHLAAEPAGVEPVEQRRAASANMQKAGGRGGETRYDGFSHSGGNFRWVSQGAQEAQKACWRIARTRKRELWTKRRALADASCLQREGRVASHGRLG